MFSYRGMDARICPLAVLCPKTAPNRSHSQGFSVGTPCPFLSYSVLPPPPPPGSTPRSPQAATLAAPSPLPCPQPAKSSLAPPSHHQHHRRPSRPPRPPRHSPTTTGSRTPTHRTLVRPSASCGATASPSHGGGRNGCRPCPSLPTRHPSPLKGLRRMPSTPFPEISSRSPLTLNL